MKNALAEAVRNTSIVMVNRAICCQMLPLGSLQRFRGGVGLASTLNPLGRS